MNPRRKNRKNREEKLPDADVENTDEARGGDEEQQTGADRRGPVTSDLLGVKPSLRFKLLNDDWTFS